MTPARVAVFVVGAAFLSVVGVGCYPCGGPCGDIVYPFPIQSDNYGLDYRFAEDCPFGEADAGTTDDAGVAADAGGETADAGIAPICNESVSVDAASRIVTHSFTYRGQTHVVRYRVTGVEAIPKDRYDWNDW